MYICQQGRLLVQKEQLKLSSERFPQVRCMMMMMVMVTMVVVVTMVVMVVMMAMGWW
jgi:hypothetical protein